MESKSSSSPSPAAREPANRTLLGVGVRFDLMLGVSRSASEFLSTFFQEDKAKLVGGESAA